VGKRCSPVIARARSFLTGRRASDARLPLIASILPNNCVRQNGKKSWSFFPFTRQPSRSFFTTFRNNGRIKPYCTERKEQEVLEVQPKSVLSDNPWNDIPSRCPKKREKNIMRKKRRAARPARMTTFTGARQVDGLGLGMRIDSPCGNRCDAVPVPPSMRVAQLKPTIIHFPCNTLHSREPRFSCRRQKRLV